MQRRGCRVLPSSGCPWERRGECGNGRRAWPGLWGLVPKQQNSQPVSRLDKHLSLKVIPRELVKRPPPHTHTPERGRRALIWWTRRAVVLRAFLPPKHGRLVTLRETPGHPTERPADTPQDRQGRETQGEAGPARPEGAEETGPYMLPGSRIAFWDTKKDTLGSADGVQMEAWGSGSSEGHCQCPAVTPRCSHAFQ